MQLDTDVSPKTAKTQKIKMHQLIEFKNVSFNYQNETISALKNLSLTIKKGDRIAIIGRAGSGKSTIAKLLLKLYSPNEGSITVDGVDCHNIDTDYWRQHVGYMGQEVVLFYGSIRDNISVGAPFAPDSAVLEAAKISGVTRFTENHHQGFNRQVGEKGCNLSGGQRQAVAIARTLLTNPAY